MNLLETLKVRINKKFCVLKFSFLVSSAEEYQPYLEGLAMYSFGGGVGLAV